MLLFNLFVFVTVAVVGVDALKLQHLKVLQDRSPSRRRCRPRPPQSKTEPSPPATATSSQPAPATTPPSDYQGAPSSSGLTPNNIKAGIAGGDAYPFVKDHIGWWYDWYGPPFSPLFLQTHLFDRSPNPSKPGAPIAVPMLWGGGTVDAQDAQRLKDFSQISTVPPYVLGFEEPDCPRGSGSADMSVAEAVEKWESLMAPMKKKGAKLGSPSMCSAFPLFFLVWSIVRGD